MTDYGFKQLARRLGDRIRALRIARQMTQEELAEASGMSPSFLVRLEKGMRSPSLQALYAIAVALGAEAGFDNLFAAPPYRSIDEVLADARSAPKRQRVRHKKAP